MSDYLDFLARKTETAAPAGIPIPTNLPADLKPFQRDIVEWALKRGRGAIFAGCGLGKTIQQLAWAQAVQRHTDAPVLILTPLAVAEQTVSEARKFGIDGVAYAKDDDGISTPIVITNYDRFHLFDLDGFAGIVCDESSILKSHDSKTRIALTDACRTIPYRLCCTATPAPNDWTEIGQHSEFLGVMNAKEMLAMYFVHDGSIRAHTDNGADGDGWRLKGHATKQFWAWVASWAVMIRSPTDLGYDEPGYVLPPLVKHQITVPVEYAPIAGMLFPTEAHTMSERLAARRDSVADRVEAAARIVNAAPDRPWIIWCNLNAEADAITAAIPGAVQVSGRDRPEDKVSRLLGFATGKIRVIVTKFSIAGFGMNFQICADMIALGLNDSFEQLFQGIRRCWRFGQMKPVNVYMVASELEGAVVSNLDRKERDFESMADAMALHMIDLTRKAVRGGRQASSPYNPQKPMEIPTWM